MIAESIVAVIIVAFYKKYNMMNAEDFPQRFVAFPLIFVLLQFLLLTMAKTGVNPTTIRTLHMLGFLLFLPYCITNCGYKGMLIMLAGVIMNVAVMSQNGGMMPVEPYYFRMITSNENYRLTYEGLNLYHCLITDETRLKIFADIIPLIKPYPLQKLVSIGDLFIAGGFITLALTTLRGDYKKTSEERNEDEEEN